MKFKTKEVREYKALMVFAETHERLKEAAKGKTIDEYINYLQDKEEDEKLRE